jgi:hypothetical protein
MQESLYKRSHGRRTNRTGLLLTLAVLTFLAFTVGLFGLWQGYRKHTQMQNDPRVARVWVAGTTFGRHHQIQRGSSLQRWLNTNHISLLGDYEVVQSQFSNDPDGLEIWFNYESYLIGYPELECHRINPAGTAFIDDLGQPYHGYLDLHGKTVGVYLPGYDHAAHQIRCIVKWMPRRPTLTPMSRPMVFTVDLPQATRVLPPASSLPRAVSLTKSGVTVMVDAVQLGPFKPANGAAGQRDLTFHLRIAGGEIANDNIANDLSLAVSDSALTGRLHSIIVSPIQPLRLFSGRGLNANLQPQRQVQYFPASSDSAPMTFTDPYGISLIAPGQSIAPVLSKDILERARRGQGMVWRAPVIGAGKGTDVIRVHLDVRPRAQSGHSAPASETVPFDLCVPVQTGDEI